MFSGAEDLVPEFKKDNKRKFIIDSDGNYVLDKFSSSGGECEFKEYCPCIEGIFSRIDGDMDLKLTAHRWVGNGRTILINKGNPIKKYEPYFSDSHWYEYEPDLQEAGVTRIFYYDAAGRCVMIGGVLATSSASAPEPYRNNGSNTTVSMQSWLCANETNI